MSRQSIKVFFRYDDYSAVSDDSVDRGLVKVFQRHGLSCTIAVIPKVTEGNYRDSAPRGHLELAGTKLELLKHASGLGVVDVALHGLYHRSNGLGLPHSEFRGLDYATQSGMIRESKACLDSIIGRPVIAFVPPWNTYDDATLEALYENGLKCLSANRFGPFSRAAPGMRFVPITAELSELETAIDRARQSGDDAPIVGILMHPYDFLESGDSRAQTSLDELDRKLQWLVNQPGVAPVTVSELAREDESLDIRRFAANRPLEYEQLAPPGAVTVEDTPYYSSASHALRKRRKRLIGTVAIHGAGVTAGLAGGILITRMLHGLGSWTAVLVIIVLAILLALLLWRARQRNGMYFRSMFLTMGLAGALLGTLAATVIRV